MKPLRFPTGSLAARAVCALALAVVFLAPPGVGRPAVFWGLLALLAACGAAARAPWGPAARAGAMGAGLLGPACLALALAGLAALVADKAAHVAACGLGSGFISEIMEGREVVKAWLLSSGQSIYTGLSDYPLLATLYGPLYYILAAWSADTFGPGVFSARLVSVAAGLALAATAGAVAYRLSKSLTAALACAGLALVTPTMAYAAHARPDVLVWLTLFAGIFCLLGAARAPRRTGWAFWGSAVFFTLAAFSKQQTWAYMAAALGYCLWDRTLRPLGLRLCLALGASCALALWGMQAVTDGQFARQTILFPKRMAALTSYNSFQSAGERFAEFARAHWGLILVSAASLAVRRPRIGLMEASFLAGLGSMVMVMRWWGSSVNHFLGLALFMLIECARLLARLLREGRPGWAALAVALIAPPTFSVSVPSGPDPCGLDGERVALASLEERMASVLGPVAMDAEGAYALIGRPDFARLRLYDAWETDFLDKTGLWSFPDSVLARDVRQRRLGAFVDSRVFMSEDLAWLVRAYYRQDFTAGRYAVYVPREDAAILRFPGLSGPCGDGGCLKVVSSGGLKDWGNYLQPADGAAALVLEAGGLEPGDVLRVAYHPRLTAPGQEVRLYASSDGRDWALVAAEAWQGPPPGTGFENGREAVVPVAGRSVLLKWELSGAAQLWATQRRPALAYVERPGRERGR